MNEISVTILGCGSSDGVPQVGCNCDVCISAEQKNKRTRSSILVEIGNFKLLIDVGPDLRQQAIREGISVIDAVIITHPHYDHIGGIGDLKVFMQQNGRVIPIYADPITTAMTEATFRYAFSSKNILYQPIVESYPFYGPFSINQVLIQPFKQQHGKFFSYGFRIGDFAYSTDVSTLDVAAYEILKDVKYWIVDCIRYYKSPTHFCLDDTVKAILRVQPGLAIFTHMCHDIDYNALSANLPSNIKVGYDGMKIRI